MDTATLPVNGTQAAATAELPVNVNYNVNYDTGEIENGFSISDEEIVEAINSLGLSWFKSDEEPNAQAIVPPTFYDKETKTRSQKWDTEELESYIGIANVIMERGSVRNDKYKFWARQMFGKRNDERVIFRLSLENLNKKTTLLSKFRDYAKAA